MSLWLRHLLGQYREHYGCLPAENDFCEPPSSEDGIGPNQPCRLCRLTDAVLKAGTAELEWHGEEAGTFTAAVGTDEVATLAERPAGAKGWTWKLEHDDGQVLLEGQAPTLTRALYACERELAERTADEGTAVRPGRPGASATDAQVSSRGAAVVVPGQPVLRRPGAGARAAQRPTDAARLDRGTVPR